VSTAFSLLPVALRGIWHASGMSGRYLASSWQGTRVPLVRPHDAGHRDL
jgi:hypothetical protein